MFFVIINVTWKNGGYDMREVTEYDGHWMPPPFKGEFTPEVLAAKEKAEREAAEIRRRLDRELNITSQQ